MRDDLIGADRDAATLAREIEAWQLRYETYATLAAKARRQIWLRRERLAQLPQEEPMPDTRVPVTRRRTEGTAHVHDRV